MVGVSLLPRAYALGQRTASIGGCRRHLPGDAQAEEWQLLCLDVDDGQFVG